MSRKSRFANVLLGFVVSIAWVQEGAARARPVSLQPQGVALTEPGASPRISLYAQPSRDDTFAFILVVDTAGGCKYPVGLLMSVRVDGSATEKRVARFSQDPQPDGSCIEALGTVFTRPDFLPLTRATRIELTLPTGTVVLPQAALGYLQSLAGTTLSAPDGVAPATTPAEDFTSLSREVLRLAGQRRFAEAVPVAERAISASEGRALAERMMALSNAGYVKRFAGDQAGAAASYEQAVAIAEQAGYEGADLGVVLDNLARVLSANKDYVSAEAASLRAIRILSKNLGERHPTYGGALNNLSLMYHAKGDSQRALDYSNRAIDILREALAGNPAALEPFLEDNRVIRAAATPK
jgi:hypothetical protein